MIYTQDQMNNFVKKFSLTNFGSDIKYDNKNEVF